MVHVTRSGAITAGVIALALTLATPAAPLTPLDRLIALAPATLHAQEPEPPAGPELTLEESVRMALERHGGLRAAGAEAAAAEAAYLRVRAARFPALRTQATYTRLSDNIPAVEFMLPGFDSTFTVQGVELNRFHGEVSLELPLLGQIRLGHESEAARHEATAAELRADQERSDVAFEVRRAFWNLHRALAVREHTGAAVARVDEHLSEVRQRVAEGAALERDRLAAQTRRSEVLLERVEVDNAVRVGQLELNRLIGLPLDTPVRPATVADPQGAPAPAEGPPAPPPPSDSLAGAQAGAGLAAAAEIPDAGAVQQRPQIGALTEQVLGLRAQVSAARASRLPELDFVSRYVYARPNPYFFSEQDEFRGTWEMMLSARWGVWEGGAASARAREAVARLDAAEARLEETTEQVAVDVARLRLEVRRAAEAMAVAAQNELEAEESYRVVRQQFDEGVALSSDVLDADEALRRATVRRVEALADHEIARAAVLNALGRTW